jgi:hypothetical protein
MSCQLISLFISFNTHMAWVEYHMMELIAVLSSIITYSLLIVLFSTFLGILCDYSPR